MKLFKTFLFFILIFFVADACARAITYAMFQFNLNLYPDISEAYSSGWKMNKSGLPENVDPSDIRLPVAVEIKTEESGPPPFIKTSDYTISHLESHKLDQNPASGTIRIICAGGSTTFNGYPGYLEKLLHERFPAKNFEVLDFGIPSADIRATDFLIRNLYYKFNPDFILIYHGYNDITNNPPAKSSFQDHLPRRNYGLVELFRRRFNTGFIAPPDYMKSYRKSIDAYGSYYRAVASFCTDNDIELVLSSFAAPSYNRISRNEKRFFDLRIFFFRPWVQNTDFYSQLLKYHNDKIRSIAAENEIPFASVAGVVKGGSAVFSDNCHLRKDYFEIQAKAFLDALALPVEK